MTYSPVIVAKARGILSLPSIPVVDVRDGGPVRHARDGRARALALRNTALAWFPRPVRSVVPVLDRVSQYWLARSQSPYVEEVRAIAGTLGFSGIWFLNGSYQWFCTALARDEGGAPWLARTLDWPFPGLGRYVEIARMRGPAGEFHNITWPGYVGALTAMAPGRFAAAINQAPLRRRTHSRWLRPYDLMVNSAHTLFRVRTIPPDQLLRQVFETARDFAEARQMLETDADRAAGDLHAGRLPAGRALRDRAHRGRASTRATTNSAPPTTGCKVLRNGRAASVRARCSEAASRRPPTPAARGARAWRPGAGRSSATASAGSRRRCSIPFTRIAVEMCPARGILRVVGYERPAGDEFARPVTQPRELTP